jgi:hypothetical protein
MVRFRTALALAGVVAFCSSVCGAHDIKGLANPSVKLAADLNVRSLQLLADKQPDPDARYVYSRLLLWTPSQALRSCFINGTSEEREFVVRTARELLDGKGVNLSFDFGLGPQYRACSEVGRRSDVRVSFQDSCCAAYIGRTAHHPQVKDGPSVFLQGVLSFDPEKQRQIVMHELLHVIGFDHEHQSPAVNCEQEFDKAKILAAYGWTEAEFATNLKQLERDTHSYTWSVYDTTSIMKYYFDPAFLKKGQQSPCYSSENYLPSDRDYEGLRNAYPAAAAVGPDRSRAVMGDIAASNSPAAVRELARELRSLD